jgi:hypothetical protein
METLLQSLHWSLRSVGFNSYIFLVKRVCLKPTDGYQNKVSAKKDLMPPFVDLMAIGKTILIRQGAQRSLEVIPTTSLR